MVSFFTRKPVMIAEDITGDIERTRKRAIKELAEYDANAFGGDMKKVIKDKRRQMHDAADRLDFETAALLRDEIRILETEDKSPAKS